MAEEKRKESTMEVLLDELEDEAAAVPSGAISVPPPPPTAPKAPPPPKRARPKAAPKPPAPPPPVADLNDSITDISVSELSVADLSDSVTEELDVELIAAPEAATLEEAAKQLIEACEAELKTRPDERRAARLHYEIARLFESPIADLRRAASHYQEALKRHPEHLPTLRGARRVLIARRSYQAALKLFDEEIRMTSDPSRKAALLHAQGRLQEDVLGRKDEARDAYANALELDRDNPAILRSLRVRYAEEQRHEDVDRVLERSANAVASDARHRAALVAERAHLAEVKSSDPERATELYEIALRLDLRAPGALAALKRLHRGRRRWRDLIRILTLEAESTEVAEVRTAALFRIAQLHADRLGNRNEATTALEKGLQDAPDDSRLLTEIARLYELSGRWDALAEVLQRLAHREKLPRARLGLLHRLGVVHNHRLQQNDAATHWYEAALAIDPTHVPTLQALAPLYTAKQAWAELLRMHLGEAEHAKSGERRAAAHVRAAEVFEERLEDPGSAVEHHAKALAIEPGYAAAFKGMSRLLSQGKRYRELIELHEAAVDLATTSPEAIAHLLKVGSVHEDLLGDPAQAAHAYKRILELDRDHLQAIQALQRATEQAGRFRELIEALELEAERTEDSDRVVALLHRAGEVADELLGDREGALRLFRRVLDARADYRPALTSLGRLHHALGRWEDLLEIYKRELELADGGPDSVALLEKMAELCQERIGREEEALEYYRRALQIDSAHGPSLRALIRRLQEREDWKALISVLQMQLSGQTEPEARAQTAYQIGLVREEHTEERGLALKSYQQALQEVPSHRPSLDAIARLRTQDSAWSALVDDLRHEAEATTDPQLQIDALMRRGEIYAGELNEPRKAIACFEDVLERDSAHLGALLALESLYRRVGSWDLLAKTHAAQARVFVDPAARIAALEAQAQVFEARNLGQPADLIAVYEGLLELDASHEPALLGLERVALATSDPARLASVDQRLAATAEEASLQAAHLTRLGESLEALDREGALEAFRAALEQDPDSISATRGLARAAQRLDDPTLLAEAARRQARIAQVPREEAEFLVQSAQVRIERLGDEDGALADLDRALELDSDSENAAYWSGRLLRAQGMHARLAELLARAANDASPHRASALWLEVAQIQAEDLGNVTQAIASLTRVLRASPNHVPTLRKLAEYHVRDSQWSEAVKMLSRVVQLAPDHDILRAAHLQLAELWMTRLGEASRALVSLQAVLQIDPQNTQALAYLVDLHERDQRFDEATDAARRLLGSARSPADRSRALLRVAQLERGRGNDAAAAESLLEAVALEGAGSEAALEYKATCSSTAAWHQYVAALEKHLHSLDPKEAGPTYLEMGRVVFDQLERPNDAVNLLERGAAQSKDAQLKREFALRLRMVGRHTDAIDALQALANEDVTRSEVWRELVRTYAEAQRPIEARLASGPLLVLGTATARENQVRAAAPPRPGMARPGSLSNLLERLGTPTADQKAAGELLRAIEPALPKLYPPELDSYGLSTRDKLTTRAGHPLRAVADELASILGVTGYELFVHHTRNRGMATELGNPTMIIVPAAVGELPRTQQVFLLARPLVHIARGFAAVDKLTPRELEVLLASAARNVRPRHGTGLTSEEVLDAQGKRVHKALSRRQRKAMEESASLYVEAGRVDFPRWARAAQRTANRIAALLADDLAACVDVLRRTERDLSAMNGATLVTESTVVSDLVTFWASKAAMHVRKHAGLLD
ncbi:MAG: tetratricopeptide repeat protein [Myxococcota bacterium]